MLKVIKVTGESLSPAYQEGDYVLVGTWSFFFDINVGDTIVFRHPEYGMMIKMVAKALRSNQSYIVKGDHPYSVDSRSFGPVPKDLVLGKVLWHIQQP
jgi:nickel-type superoxide dismutase maturation protease